jgi:biotin carboxyl carrier protein
MQKDRSVVFFYKNIHEFNITMGATKGKEPRFMTFIASPLLLCAATKDIESQSRPVHSTSSVLPNLTVHQTQVAIKGTGPEHTFRRWFVDSGDPVRPGSWIVLTRHPATGRMTIVTSNVTGTVAAIHHSFVRGDIILDRVKDNVMAVLQKTEKLPPLEYNPDFETPVRTDVPGYIFGHWIVEVGDEVKTGDKLAKAYTPENEEVDIIARCDGKVKALQPLPPHESIDVLVHDQMVAIITRQESIITKTATATTTTSVTPTSTTKTTSTSTSTGTSSTSTSTITTTTTVGGGGIWPR